MPLRLTPPETVHDGRHGQSITLDASDGRPVWSIASARGSHIRTSMQIEQATTADQACGDLVAADVSTARSDLERHDAQHARLAPRPATKLI